MSSGSRFKNGAAVMALAFAVAAGCGQRWLPAKSYEVPAQGDAQRGYEAAVAVAKADNYKIVSQDAAGKKLKLQSHINDESFVNVEVDMGTVWLSASGSLLRDGKVHTKLNSELKAFEKKLKDRLANAGASNSAVASVSPAQPGANAAGVPEAWSEPAYDPSVWGNGNFTCIPVKVPAEHQAALSLQLSNGEKADLQLSLAYAPELCRSPAQCKVAGGGCPALGIGDSEKVKALAGRLSRNEVGAKAVLFDGATPVVTIDLSRHGSVVQAMSEIKK
jgi:hypothetical protein